MKKGMVSVIVPNYNYADFLVETIDSVIAQTYINWELIVVDDNSSDNSRDVVRQYIEKYPHLDIQLIHVQSGPSGTSVPINTGIKHMKGEYFAWLSSDDKFKENKLELQVQAMEKNPDVGVIHSNYDFIDGNGDILPGEIFNYDIKDPIDIFCLMLEGNIINGNTVLIRKEIFEQIGVFIEKWESLPRIWMVADYVKWIEMALHTKILFINDRLHYARMHAENSPYYSSGLNVEFGRCVMEYISQHYKTTDLIKIFKLENQLEKMIPIETLLMLKLSKSAKTIESSHRVMEMQQHYPSLYEAVKKNLEEIDRLVTIAGLAKFYILKQRFYEEIQGFYITPDYLKYLGNNDLYSIASAFKKSGDHQTATIIFKALLDKKNNLDQYKKNTYFHLGEIYFQNNDFQEAKAYFSTLLTYIPDHKSAQSYLEKMK